MSHTFVRNSLKQNNAFKFKKVLNAKKSPMYLAFGFGVFFIAMVVVLTLVFSVRQVTNGYVLNELDAKRQELLRERELRDMQISKVRSLNEIQSSEKVAGMVPAFSVVFVEEESNIAFAD